MKRTHSFLAPGIASLIAVFIAGCANPPPEVVSMGDGLLRGTTSQDALAYCSRTGMSLRMVGKAPAESGVLFRCER
jgi:hypothetical protein